MTLGEGSGSFFHHNFLWIFIREVKNDQQNGTDQELMVSTNFLVFINYRIADRGFFDAELVIVKRGMFGSVIRISYSTQGARLCRVFY